MSRGLQVKLRLSPDIVIAVDRKSQAWQITVPISRAVKRSRFTPACADLCVGHHSYAMSRLHFCCFMNLFGVGCRLPRVRDGTLAAAIPVRVYFLAIHENRGLRVLKDFLLRKVLSVAEVLAN